MASEELIEEKLVFRPVTANEWKDLEDLFTQSGVCSGCWCMYWRMKRSEFDKQYGEGNKEAMRDIIESGGVPGILAYLVGKPIGWCSVAPRDSFPVLDRSPTLKRIDDEPVWSIVCFVVAKPFRRKGLAEILTMAAIEYAREKGARVIEAYPLIPENSKAPSPESYMGVITTFARIGFKEAVRRSRIRPIMRYYIQD